jgi:hypothetical protein
MLFVIFVFVVFFILTPGILVTLPKKGTKTVVALVHGLLFATILAISGHFFWKSGNSVFEGATGGTTENEVTTGLEELKALIGNLKKNELEKQKTGLLNKLSVIMNNHTKSKMTPEEITKKRIEAWKQICPKPSPTKDMLGKATSNSNKCITDDPPPKFMPNGV